MGPGQRAGAAGGEACRVMVCEGTPANFPRRAWRRCRRNDGRRRIPRRRRKWKSRQRPYGAAGRGAQDRFTVGGRSSAAIANDCLAAETWRRWRGWLDPHPRRFASRPWSALRGQSPRKSGRDAVFGPWCASGGRSWSAGEEKRKSRQTPRGTGPGAGMGGTRVRSVVCYTTTPLKSVGIA
jgi:hypothetical protein